MSHGPGRVLDPTTFGPTIILYHGFRVPRHHLHPVAALEYRSGYNSLLFDFRGHGQSARAVTSGGIAEVRDLEAAWKATRKQPERIRRHHSPTTFSTDHLKDREVRLCIREALYIID